MELRGLEDSTRGFDGGFEDKMVSVGGDGGGGGGDDS